jgi:dienelactone hydrolase
MGTVPRTQPTRPKRNYLFLLLLLPFVGLALIPTTSEHLRAASLLLRIQNANDHSWLARFHTYQISESPIQNIATANGIIRTRMYTPLGSTDPPGMVVVHGVHHLGIEEPRLVAFSRALCASGIQVFTPELPDIADYHISHSSVDTIGPAVQYFSNQIGKRVGILGLSFAGGEALLAAADPRYSPTIAFVVSIGAHDDLHRVADFFVTGRIPKPDGTIVTLKPHEYGPLVLVYSHLDEFFPKADVAPAQTTLRLFLWEQVDDSKRASKALSEPSRELMEHVYDHDDSQLKSALKLEINRHAQEMAEVSPHGQLSSLHVPILLLHGSEDDVIPSTEMLWLEKDVPHDYLRQALITPLLTHVSVAGEPPLRDKIALVHFMAALFDLADHSRAKIEAAN